MTLVGHGIRVNHWMTNERRLDMKLYKLIILLTSIFVNTNLQADTILRLTHQWPGNTGDLRHEMAKIIQIELKKSNLGIGLEIDAKDQLKMRPWQQWSAMLSGTTDMSVYPLAYAGPNHPAFNLTLMPGIIKNHEHARRFNQSKVMQKIKSIINDAGISGPKRVKDFGWRDPIGLLRNGGITW